MEDSFSNIDYSANTTSDSVQGTQSTLQYINSQLLAHGFIHGPPLVFEGLDRTNEERLVKCLLGMLGTRVEDMSRTEELTTKFRTLSYDHERLTARHREASARAANAEREMHVFKSRLAAATRTLQQTDAAHKHTQAELSRTRTAMQALRAQHQVDIKKKEKECERMVERWGKLADTQLKVGSLPGTLNAPRCANALVSDPSQLLGNTQHFLDGALEESEAARRVFARENGQLRSMTTQTVNEIQDIIYVCKAKMVDEGGMNVDVDEPIRLETLDLFPLSPIVPDAAEARVAALMQALRDTISAIDLTPTPSSSSPDAPPSTPGAERLQALVNKLTADLAQARKQAHESAAQTQALVNQLAEAEADEPEQGGMQMSLELMTAPAADAERARLEARVRELEAERARFTDAAVRFGKEKAGLERERERLEEEKRRWGVEKILADLPDTPEGTKEVEMEMEEAVEEAPVPSLRRSQIGKRDREKPRSPSKKMRSPVKVGAGSRKTRIRRSSSGVPGLGSLLSPGKGKVIPAFETEVIPPPNFKMGGAPLVPGTFVLPPPSPGASLPPQPTMLSAPNSPVDPIPMPALSLPAFELPPTASPSSQLGPPPKSPESRPAGEVPRTPDVRKAFGFPVAKPFAPGMRHAYSPARPSPLSRILMLADTPEGGVPGLGALMEEDESGEGPLEPSPTARLGPIPMDIEEESPLREKKVERNHDKGAKAKAQREKEKDDARRFTTQEKGKGKGAPAPAPSRAPAKAKAAVAGEKRRAPPPTEKEKENGRSTAKRARAASTAAPARTAKPPVPPARAAAAVGGKPGAAARRVPVTSLPPESLPAKGPGRKS